MMTKSLLCTVLVSLACVVWSCSSSGGGDGNHNGNSNANDNFSSSVDLELGDGGRFELAGGNAAEHTVHVSLTEELGINQLTELGFAISADDVSVQPDDPTDVTSNALTTLEVLLAAADTAGVCTSGLEVGRFDITFGTNGVPTVTPAQIVADTAALTAAGHGVFELCLRASSSMDQVLTVERLQVRFDATVPFKTCAELFALEEVQAAVGLLANDNRSFALQEGDRPLNIEGTYRVRETTEVTPDGTGGGTPRERTDVLSDQTGDRITRSSGQASLEQSISGSDTGVNLCVLARSSHAGCDQTIARLESYSVAGGGTALEGPFLAVVVERHSTAPATCGDVGDFIYGSIDLTRQSTTFQVSRLGKITLPEGFVPDLIILADDGTIGTVTDRDSASALQFALDGLDLTVPLAVPDTLTANGYNGIALSQDNRLLALVSNFPDELLIFDYGNNALVLETTANNEAQLGGDVFDFSPDGQRVYVVSPDPGDADNVSVFRTSDGADPLEAQFPTPEARTPQLSRLDPAGDQLAVLLQGSAGDEEAQWLTFMNAQTGDFTPPIDLQAATGGYVKARYLIYNKEGTQVFAAGRNGVVAVQTSDPFTVTPIDVSGDHGDAAVAIDLSQDGAVVAVAVDRVNGDSNFAIVDVATLTVLNRQMLERISNRGAIDVAHFDTGRVCLVVNERERVVAVQTADPYSVSEEISAADDEFATILGRAAAGGNVIAITNTTETALYLFALAP